MFLLKKCIKKIIINKNFLINDSIRNYAKKKRIMWVPRKLKPLIPLDFQKITDEKKKCAMKTLSLIHDTGKYLK
jgi:hypothetical protein